jgi:hypothetical protein
MANDYYWSRTMVIDGLLSFNFDVVFYSMYSDSVHSSPINRHKPAE